MKGKNFSAEMIQGYDKLNNNIHHTLNLINEVSTSSKNNLMLWNK